MMKELLFIFKYPERKDFFEKAVSEGCKNLELQFDGEDNGLLYSAYSNEPLDFYKLGIITATIYQDVEPISKTQNQES